MRKRLMRCLLGAACLLLVAGAGLSIKFFNVSAENKADGRLISYIPKTDVDADIGTEENPFTVLEIVPNKSRAIVGYMIPGCEPVDMEKFMANPDFVNSNALVSAGIWSAEGESYRYAFEDGLPEGYELATEDEFNSACGKWFKYNNAANPGYSEYGYYEYVGDGNGSYDMVVTEAEEPVAAMEELLSAESVSETEAAESVEAGMEATEVMTGVEGTEAEKAEVEKVVTAEAVADMESAKEQQIHFEYKENGAYNWVCAGYYYPAKNGEGTHNRIGDTTTGYSFVEAANGAYAYALAEQPEDEEGTTEPESPYWAIRTDEFYYRYTYYKYHNKNVLIPTCFESENGYEDFKAQVITMAPNELTDENLGIIDVADLIVINATVDPQFITYWENCNREGLTLAEAGNAITFAGTNGNDLSWTATKQIVERMASENPAAMILEATQMAGNGHMPARYNIEKLYMMLMQYDAKVFKAMFLDDCENFVVRENTVEGKTFETGTYINKVMGKTEPAYEWDAQTFNTPAGVAAMHQNQFDSGAVGEVFGSILTYQGGWIFYQEFMSDKIGELGQSRDDSENKFPTNSELFDYYQDKNNGVRPPNLSMLNGSEYILSQIKNKDGLKKARILEVQPCNQFIYGSFGWQGYYANLLPGFRGDLNKDLTVTTKTTYELNGDISDLNEEYDLILIGGLQDESNGLNSYNDINMTVAVDATKRIGMIYTGLGDTVEKTTENVAWNYGDLASYYWGSDAYQMNSRFSGNDLTKKKYEELREYLNTGKPIVVAGNLYKDQTKAISFEKVDANSYIYQLGNMVYNGNQNKQMLFREGMYKDTNGYNLLKSVLSNKPLEMILDSGPEVYDMSMNNGTAQVTYNTGKDTATGKPQLRYEFSLTGNENTEYGVKLYIDRNSDGIFDGSIKEIKELEAVENSGNVRAGEAAAADRLYIMDESGNVVADDTLRVGQKYVVTYTLSDIECGILPWKLEVYDKNNKSIRCSKMNFTAVKATAENKVKIHVLQMNPVGNMEKDAAPGTYINFANQETDAGKKFAEYLKGVADYRVQYDFMGNADWYEAFGKYDKNAADAAEKRADLIEKWETYLKDVDILVLGFGNMVSVGNDIFYEGFKDFAASGKGIILSHDLIGDATLCYKDPGHLTPYTTELRTLAGQRRKYYQDSSNDGLNRNKYRYKETKIGTSNGAFQTIDLAPKSGAVLMVKNELQPTQKKEYLSKVVTNNPEGNQWYVDDASEMMDNSVQLLWNYTDKADIVDRVMDARPADNLTSWAEPANQGQIMKYPYDIEELQTTDEYGSRLYVAPTHAQSFQLDLEQNNGGDVTVWCNLTNQQENGLYSSRPQDARNNYYLYTKGNIVYTGLGHNAEVTDSEIKLYINTLMGAYRPIPEDPYVKVTNDDAVRAGDTYTMYIMDTGAQEDKRVYFTVVEESILEPGARSYKLKLECQKADGSLYTEEIPLKQEGDVTPEKLPELNCYKVIPDGKYFFDVPHEAVKANGEMKYNLILSSTYNNGTKTIETSEETKVVVYDLPLFTLN